MQETLDDCDVSSETSFYAPLALKMAGIEGPPTIRHLGTRQVCLYLRLSNPLTDYLLNYNRLCNMRHSLGKIISRLVR